MDYSDFDRDGFLVLPGFVEGRKCDLLKSRALELASSCNPGEFSSVFSSYLDADQQAPREYIRGSADKTRFFFEKDAFDERGVLTRPKEQALCKIGHGMHDCDPVFNAFSRAPRLEELARALGFRSPLLAQSMYLFKQPGVGAEIACHQDASFIFTMPSSVVAFWVAIEDASVDNGCLRVLPGGHKEGLRSRFVRTAEGEAFEHYDRKPLPEDEFLPLEAGKGTLIVLHGFLPHLSRANLSTRSRHAFTLHLIEGGLPYPSENWLQRTPEAPFRGFR